MVEKEHHAATVALLARCAGDGVLRCFEWTHDNDWANAIRKAGERVGVHHRTNFIAARGEWYDGSCTTAPGEKSVACLLGQLEASREPMSQDDRRTALRTKCTVDFLCCTEGEAGQQFRLKPARGAIHGRSLNVNPHSV